MTATLDCPRQMAWCIECGTAFTPESGSMLMCSAECSRGRAKGQSRRSRKVLRKRLQLAGQYVKAILSKPKMIHSTYRLNKCSYTAQPRRVKLKPVVMKKCLKCGGLQDRFETSSRCLLKSNLPNQASCGGLLKYHGPSELEAVPA